MSTCRPERDSCSAAALSWQKIIHEARAAAFEQLKTVNAFFNRWPYRLDIDVYGESDYWATPQEFLRLSGDCEDYSITKYYALKQLGVPVDRMRIVMLFDTIRGIAHAVLAVSRAMRPTFSTTCPIWSCRIAAMSTTSRNIRSTNTTGGPMLRPA